MTSRIESAPAAERYFCTLSPLCKRIISNVQTIRTLHADGWDELSYADQCQVIDGHMVNQETADHWRRLSRQPGDGAPSGWNSTPPKVVEDEDPETGQTVRWRDEHAAPFSWRTPSQERVAASCLQAEQESPTHRQSFVVRDSIRNRLSRVEHMYESYSPKRTVGERFDSPSLVLGGSSGAEPAAASRSLKQQVLARLAHGRRVLLSITRLGKQPAAAAARPAHLRRPEISPPRPGFVTPQPVISAPQPEVSSPQPASRSPQPEAASPRHVSSSASFRRLTKPSAPPPPPPVQAALVPIRTAAAHAPSVRTASQYAAPAGAPPSPPPPTAGARCLPTPPQLKRVAPPVVPRRDEPTPEREVEPRADGDGSELAQSPRDEPPPPSLYRREPTPDSEPLYRREPAPESKPLYRREPTPDSEPLYRREPTPESKPLYRREPTPDSEPLYRREPTSEPKPEPEPEPEPESGQEQAAFHSVLEQPTEVDIKTGFDFLDNW